MAAPSAPPYNGTHQGEDAKYCQVIIGWPARNRQHAHGRSDDYQRPEIHGSGFGVPTRPLPAQDTHRARCGGDDAGCDVYRNDREKPRLARWNRDATDSYSLVKHSEPWP